MASILVQILSGPENPTKAAFGFLIAKTALTEGHEVNIFLAGDAVQLLRDSVLNHLSGFGTGDLKEHYENIIDDGVVIYLAQMSCDSRGVTDEELENKPVKKVGPSTLISLALSSDKVLSY